MDSIDALDYQIIDLLAEDGRMSCSEMGRRLGMPARTIRYRLDRLLDASVIEVSRVVNPASFGFAVQADVLIETEAGQMFKVAEAMTKLPQVSYVACSTGDRDVSIQIFARSLDDLFQFVADKVQNIPGVRRTQTILLPVKYKDVHHWSPPNPYRPKS